MLDNLVPASAPAKLAAKQTAVGKMIKFIVDSGKEITEPDTQ